MTEPSPQRRPRLIYLLTTAQRRLEAWIERDSGGMTAARIGLLLALPVEGGLPMAALARALDLGAPSLTGLVDRMSKSGLVRRVPDPDDGRSLLVQLTDAGRATRARALQKARVLNDQLHDGFTEAEIAIVARWLEKVRAGHSP